MASDSNTIQIDPIAALNAATDLNAYYANRVKIIENDLVNTRRELAAARDAIAAQAAELASLRPADTPAGQTIEAKPN